MVRGRLGSLLCLLCVVSAGCLAQPEGMAVLRWTELPLGPVPLGRQVWLTLPTRVPLTMVRGGENGGFAPPAVSHVWRSAHASEGWSWRRARPELNLRSDVGFTSLRLQGDRVRLRFESHDRTLQWQLQLSPERINMEYRWRF